MGMYVKSMMPSLYQCRCRILQGSSTAPSLSSNFFQSRKASYEGFSKTHAELINKIDPNNVKMIEAYNTLGFRLTDNKFICGPMILVDDHVFCWNIKDESEINHKSLEFFMHIHPPLDILIIGYADESRKEMFSKNIPLFGHVHNVAIEMLPVTKAIATYNFLVKSRRIGGAFLPIKSSDASPDDNLDFLLENDQGEADVLSRQEAILLRKMPGLPKFVRRPKNVAKDKNDVKLLADVGKMEENDKK